MKSILQLNLRGDDEKAEPTDLPKPEREEREPDVVWKKVDQIANKATHKVAGHNRYASGIFSK